MLRKFLNIILILGIILVIVPFLSLFIKKNINSNFDELSLVQLVQKVIIDNDLNAFHVLIKRNQILVPKGNIILGKKNPCSVNYADYYVDRSKKIYSDGNEFYVVIITQTGYYEGIHIEHQRVFVFNEDGKCIHDSGEFTENGKRLFKEISVLTLGSENFWFIFESTTSNEHQLPQNRQVFLISSTMQKLLVVHMQINSFSYTVTPDQSKINGVKLSFNLNDPKSFFVDEDGEKIEPIFRWNENECCFYGYKKAFVEKRLWYCVDMEKSLRFIDIQSKIP
jgi:hypothetical protein